MGTKVPRDFETHGKMHIYIRTSQVRVRYWAIDVSNFCHCVKLTLNLVLWFRVEKANISVGSQRQHTYILYNKCWCTYKNDNQENVIWTDNMRSIRNENNTRKAFVSLVFVLDFSQNMCNRFNNVNRTWNSFFSRTERLNSEFSFHISQERICVTFTLQ